MADTIAVMNAGVIEQMGAPDRAVREPADDVRRQLPRPVQPDRGRRSSGRAGDVVTVDMHGIVVSIPPTGRTHADGDQGWVGIRPEKVLIGEVGEALDAPGNTIPGGVVSDVSFVGVSTQYLVRMPWGQELQVFEQNTGRRRLFRTGEKVELSWRPEYAFLLDRSQDATAGVPQEDVEPDALLRRRHRIDRAARAERRSRRLPAAAPGGALARPVLRRPARTRWSRPASTTPTAS